MSSIPRDDPVATATTARAAAVSPRPADRVQWLMHDLRRALGTPSRNPRMAVAIGRLLAIAFLLCFGTGLFSHFLQEPLSFMTFPTRPVGLYQVSQGIHITAGILCFPLLFAKLYIVYPELFQSPPVTSFTNFLERASIALFVAASLVEITIGLLNTYQWYVFPFAFRQTHFALSFVIIGSLAIHIGVKLDLITRYWTRRSTADAPASVDTEGARDGGMRDEGIRSTGVTGRLFAWIDRPSVPSVSVPSATAASTAGPSASPSTPTVADTAANPTSGARAASASRRAFLTTVALASAALVALTAGQSFKLLDATNAFAPRKKGVGPQSVPVNRTASAAKVEERATAADWALTISDGSVTAAFTREMLLALPQHEVDLPIACVEGWSQMAHWRGPRLSELLAAAGVAAGTGIRATSLEEGSIYAVMDMGAEYVRDDLTLVALELNGADLDLDHGYPARMIAPARPGVLQTKWLSTIEVTA